jgi:Uma2 family endonuclease
LTLHHQANYLLLKMSAIAQIESPPFRIPEPLPLQNGDALSSREFLRRYEAMSEKVKAELIEGIVYMASPVSRIHSKPDGLVQTWLGNYAAATLGVEHLTNTTVILDADNTEQPDALLRLLPERGGPTTLDEDQYVVGAPELVVQVAVSSASIDMGAKFRAFQRNGVLEYLVWLVAEKQFRWFALEEQRYVPQMPNADGLIWSRTFPGLVLAVEALVKMDAATVLSAQEKGLKSKAHADWLKAHG